MYAQKIHLKPSLTKGPLATLDQIYIGPSRTSHPVTNGMCCADLSFQLHIATGARHHHVVSAGEVELFPGQKV